MVNMPVEITKYFIRPKHIIDVSPLSLHMTLKLFSHILKVSVVASSTHGGMGAYDFNTRDIWPFRKGSIR